MFKNRTRLIDLLFRKEIKRDLRVPRFFVYEKGSRREQRMSGQDRNKLIVLSCSTEKATIPFFQTQQVRFLQSKRFMVTLVRKEENMKKKLIYTGVGVLLGLVSDKLWKTKKARALAVSAVAGGLKAKESLDKTIEKVREETGDIIAEAKVKKAEEQAQAQAEKEADKANSDIVKIAETVEETAEAHCTEESAE